MSYKIKSVLYFASLVLALITYYHIDNVSTSQNTELADSMISDVVEPGALN